MRPVLSLIAVTLRACTSSAPAVIPARFTVCAAESSSIVRLSSVSSVGASLTGLTTTSNVRLKVALSPVVAKSVSKPASSTVTVMVAVPLWSANGVNDKVPVGFALV